ncbi:PREDICTED: tigger transposable element-derived protein 6-like [Branchiostoma belcheri]|uniref:Tigger transposable element-derived protein 6-like n=1 Tax=Branchiostoma belcheri TaxID=7741 RepID=A0A6P4Z8G0_BRABE|nr:PREDICTED: tigger transposable element-derived protein 6-like [Branchiostoma belcheri]
MAEWGHPISVPILKALAGEIHQRKCKTTGKTPRFRICEASGKLVAGRKWWRGFKKRHPQIAHRAQDPLSRERAKMSSQETVDDFFKLYTKIVAENRLQNKPNLIHNCDETGISMEVNRGRVLVPKGVKGVPCKSSGTKDRVTFHIAVTAEGKTLAPMLIYKKSFPSGAYTQSGSDNTLYAVSESGFMDKDLFEKWFCNHYVRTLPPDRPVLLLLDQCEAHLSVKTIQTALDENIILLGLPPHTSHFLQPLDKTCFGSLKDTLGSIVQGLMFENPDFQLSKRNISKVVKAAYEKSFTMTTVKKGFKSTGLYPCDKNAVSKRWVNVGQSIIDVPSTSQEDSEVNNGTHVPSCQPCRAPGCKTCGPPRTNVLVGRMVPTELSDLLVPPQVQEKKTRVSKAIKTARVFTSAEVLQEQSGEKEKEGGEIGEEEEE